MYKMSSLHVFLVIVILISTAFSLPTDLGCFEAPGLDFYRLIVHEITYWVPNNATIERCLSMCRASPKNLTFALVKDKEECYCTDRFPETQPSNECNATCKGNQNEICGGLHSVNVYTVCPNGTYSSYSNECNKQCNCLDASKPCNQVSGVCFDGKCKANFTGSSCDDCVLGNHGADCSQSCGKCKNGGCYWNGECDSQGCLRGFYGDKCDLECVHCINGTCDQANGYCTKGCQIGYYGDRCELECPNCKERNCNRTDGSCYFGCEDSFCGERCDKPCQNRTVGAQESPKKCTNCRRKKCIKNDGTCPFGCISGFVGKKCDEKCGQCLDSACDDQLKKCRHGCQPGWKGTLCKQECPSGTYGHDCNRKCGHCKENCNPINGHCIGGCNKYWKGHLCDYDFEKVLVIATSVPCTIVIVIILIASVLFCLSLVHHRELRIYSIY